MNTKKKKVRHFIKKEKKKTTVFFSFLGDAIHVPFKIQGKSHKDLLVPGPYHKRTILANLFT